MGLRHGTVFIQAWDPGFGDKGRNGQVFLVDPFLWSLEWNLIFLSLGFGDKGRNGQVFLVNPFLWNLEWNLIFLSLT